MSTHLRDVAIYVDGLPNKEWYLSFAGGEGHRGACIVVAPSDMLAHTKVNLLGINPGGEVLFLELPDPRPDDMAWMELNRLYRRDELLARGFVTMGAGNVAAGSGEG